MRNIADAADSTGTGYPQLSAEYVVAASLDVIVLADGVQAARSRRPWRPGPAGPDQCGSTGSIVRIDDSIASRWGPRLVSFFRAMSAALARLQ